MAASHDNAAPLDAWPARDAVVTPPCPVDRWPRRRRNKICIAVMAIGALNFVCYTFTYAMLGGDAHNGYRRVVERADGTRTTEHFVRGHFIRNPAGEAAPVSEGMWIYSYVHSISMWLTSGAMIISMLVLARPHIVATMRDGWISGQTFVTVLGTIVVLATLGAAGLFAWDFVTQLLIS